MLAAVAVGCGGHAGVRGDAGAVDAPSAFAADAACSAQDFLSRVDQYAMEHDHCQQTSDCVAVGVFRDTCDCGPALHAAVNVASRGGAQTLIDEAVACGALVKVCDDFDTPDVSCVKGQCRLGYYGMCLPGPPDARTPDATMPDGGLQDAAPADEADGAPADAP